MAGPNFDFDPAWKPSAPSAEPSFDYDPSWSADKPKAPGGGLVASAKQAIGSLVKGAGQAAADFLPGVGQDNAVARYGQSVIDANPTAVHSVADLKDKPLTGVAEATGNAGGSMAAMLGARALGQGITAAAPLTGPLAPVTAGVGQAISWAGPLVAAALPSYGGIRQQQIQKDESNAESLGAKLAAATGAAAVGAIENKFGPQEWALSAMSKGGREKLAEKFAAKTLGGSIAKGAVKGAAVEGAEELAQNPIEQIAAFDNPLTAANLQDTAFSGVMGALGGGVLGAGSGAAFRADKAKPNQQQAQQPVAQPTDNTIPYTPTTVEEVAKQRNEAMGISPDNGPLSAAASMAVESQTAEEIRLAAPQILAEGARSAEQARAEQEARMQAEPGIPYEPAPVDRPEIPAQQEEAAQAADLQAPAQDVPAQAPVTQTPTEAAAPTPAELIQSGATLDGRNIVNQQGDVLLSNLNIQQYREAKQALKENAQTVQAAPAQAQQAKAQGSQQVPGAAPSIAQSAPSIAAQAPNISAAAPNITQESQNGPARPNPEFAGESNRPQGSNAAGGVVDSGAGGRGRAAGQGNGNNAAEPASGVPGARAGVGVKPKSLPRKTAQPAADNFLQSYTEKDLADRAEAQRVEAERQAREASQAESERAVSVPAEQGGLFDAPIKPLDHGELNIPGRTSRISAELDRYKSEQAKKAKQTAKEVAAQTRTDKAEARALLEQYESSIVARHGEKFGGKELKRTLDQWAKWEPKKLIDFVRKFEREQAGPESNQVPIKNETRANAGEKAKAAQSDQEPIKKAKPNTEELERAVKILNDRTDGVGSPDGLTGSENAKARTEIVSALTGESVKDIEASPNAKFRTSVLQVEKLLHEAAGIKDGGLSERRSKFLDWLDGRESGKAESSQEKSNEATAQVESALSKASENNDVAQPQAKQEVESKDSTSAKQAGTPLLESLFADLDSTSTRKANKAKKAAAKLPNAARIDYVQTNFLDILQELEDSGKLKINC